MAKSKLGKKILVYVVGLFILAFGIATSVRSGLGVSPQSSVMYVLSLITGIDMGTWTLIVYMLYIGIQILILRKDFKWINLTQILFSTVFGYFVSLTNQLLSWVNPSNYLSQLVLLLLSIILIAVGVTIYVKADIINMPVEGMTAAITSKWKGKEFHQVKVVVDSTAAVVSSLMSLIFLRGLYGIREGTILSALLIGVFMKPAQILLTPLLDRVLGNTVVGVSDGASVRAGVGAGAGAGGSGGASAGEGAFARVDEGTDAVADTVEAESGVNIRAGNSTNFGTSETDVSGVGGSDVGVFEDNFSESLD